MLLTNKQKNLRHSVEPITEINIRCYVHFNRQEGVHNNGTFYVGPYFNPHMSKLVNLSYIDGSTRAMSKSFYVTDRILQQLNMNIMQYFKNVILNSDNYRDFVNDTRQTLLRERQMEIKRKHNIDMDLDSIDYNIQICYNIDEVGI